MGEVDSLAVHADASASGDDDVAVVPGVADLGQALIRPRRSRIDLGGSLHCHVENESLLHGIQREGRPRDREQFAAPGKLIAGKY
jgi:hypothetical protein